MKLYYDHCDGPDANGTERTAYVIAEHDGRVLYHRLDIPWHTDPSGRPTCPARFSLPSDVFYGRYV